MLKQRLTGVFSIYLTRFDLSWGHHNFAEKQTNIPIEKCFLMNEIEKEIKDYILEEFLPGENPANLTVSTPLLSTRVLDSLAILKLVAFLEDQFNITIEAYETSEDYMDSIADIARLVQSKKT